MHSQQNPGSSIYPPHVYLPTFNGAMHVGTPVHHPPSDYGHLATVPAIATAVPVITTVPFTTAIPIVAVAAIPHSSATFVPGHTQLLEYHSTEVPPPVVQVRHRRSRQSRKGVLKRVLRHIRDFFA
ncbi:hypothetical protein HGRIS_003321 [Hohenbuehelia grisea]|uniref:Uncharacterized protein n=1 Tax=Hohenbuehelia grisea TaxID=104357 RepID=A0ABR3JG29_9AGAR